MSISTTKFLARYRSIVVNRARKPGDFQGAAEYFGVSSTMARRVYRAQALPGPTILRKMGLKAVKTISYRYEELGE